MKSKAVKCLIVAVSILLLSICAQAAESSTRAACDEAAQAANAQMGNVIGDTFKWMGIGCITSIFGVMWAMNEEIKVDTSALVGKPENYVARYVKCYKDNIRPGYVAGAIGGATLSALAIVILIVAWPFLFPAA
jgi:hypothetical protein